VVGFGFFFEEFLADRGKVLGKLRVVIVPETGEEVG
jgi:hypothetical protein